uniref:Peroxisome proliferator-activated receptor gamma coactivator 1-beta-like n=1 Tax=Neolamprologus brichardi TaxID=32507 RepID=A0A3Q4MT23_NEOBR
MADCAALLDEELSSFVFSYLTESSRSQYGEEEVCSDRLDTDFPDIDLSQLDTSDFDSVNCLSELQWCNDQSANASPASIHYSTADELFEIEEENAALLAALTDSLDGIVDAEVGGLSVFPALGEEPSQEEEGLSLSAEDFSQPLGSETEDPSLLKKLLLTPPNMPAGMDVHKEGVNGHRYCNRSLRLRPVRPLLKSDVPQERKPRAVRPAGRLCTELHRHLTTTEDTAPPDTEEEDEEEEDEDSESEEEEEEEESSSSEAEGAAGVAAAPAEAPKPQFSSEKELQSVVELIRYMHTYCLPSRKQQGWDRKDRDLLRSRARPEAPRSPATTSHSRVVLVAGPGTGGGSTGSASTATRKLPFARRREMKADSLLRTLLQQSSSFDVSKPYRLHRPPYSRSPDRTGEPAPSGPAQTPTSTNPKPDLETSERRSHSSEPPRSLEKTADCSSSFSVRRSRRLASFPSRFAKRLRPERAREEDRKEGRVGLKLPNTDLHADEFVHGSERIFVVVAEKPACLCLPLNTKSAGCTCCFSLMYSSLCRTHSGLTPPTTPPHKPVEDELFKPADGGKGGGGGGGGDRVHHQRKLPEQTELYAQLRGMGQASEADAHRGFGDHDYCLLSLGESRKRSAAIFVGAPTPRVAVEEQEGKESEDGLVHPEAAEPREQLTSSSSPPSDRQSDAATPPASEEEAEGSSVSRSPSPIPHLILYCPLSSLLPWFPCCQDNCQVFYIHNLPNSVTQNMLRKRFQVFGKAEDCKVIICNEERCGVIKIRSSGVQKHWREREGVFQNGPVSPRRLTRKRYIDLDEAGPGPVKSKYDAMDFDTLLKEAQKSLHR